MNHSRSNPIALTKHAKQRAAQRCITSKALLLLLKFGDESDTRDGCYGYRLSRKVARELVAEMADQPVLDEACKLRVIVSPSGGVVTCYHCSERTLRAHKRRSRVAKRKRNLR